MAVSLLHSGTSRGKFDGSLRLSEDCKDIGGRVSMIFFLSISVGVQEKLNWLISLKFCVVCHADVSICFGLCHADV